MSDLISHLPERGLEAALRQIEQKNGELKAAQRISGVSGQINYTLSSSNTWDITQTVTAADWTQLEFTATLNGDGTQDWPEALAYLDFRANGTGDSNKLAYLNGTYAGTTLTGFAPAWSDGTNVIIHNGTDRTYESAPRTFTWEMRFQFKGTITYYTKIVLRSSCSGSGTFSRTL